jgi:hypothetical protein
MLSIPEVLCDVADWTGWTRHFGPLPASNTKLDQPTCSESSKGACQSGFVSGFACPESSGLSTPLRPHTTHGQVSVHLHAARTR